VGAVVSVTAALILGLVIATGHSTVSGGLTDVIAIAAGAGYSLLLIATPPAIVVQTADNNVFLSWPLSAQGFALQSTTNLTDKNSWTTLTNLPVHSEFAEPGHR